MPQTDASFVKENKMGLLVLQTPIKFGMMGSVGEEVDCEDRILLLLSK
ncbi:hypothetical protein [Peribacillus simplex]